MHQGGFAERKGPGLLSRGLDARTGQPDQGYADRREIAIAWGKETQELAREPHRMVAMLCVNLKKTHTHILLPFG